MTRVMLARRALAVAAVACALGAVFALLGIASLTSRAATDPQARPAATSPAAQQRSRIVVERGTVTRVVDAVSFDVRLEGGEGVRVRALGIQSPGTCYADAGLAFARGVLEGKAVALVSDTAFPPTDRFDRRLAHAVVGRGDYAVLAAEAGVARSYSVGTTSERTQPVRDAEGRARLAARGLWGPPCSGAE